MLFKNQPVGGVVSGLKEGKLSLLQKYKCSVMKT